ncbi:hypothetical protein EMCRGX_G005717 [Ephydatia muelleri]
MDNYLFQSLASPVNKARLLSVSAPHAGSWISVVPSTGLGLHLDPAECQTAIKWWLGLDTSRGSADILVQGWVRGLPAAFDVTVSSPLTPASLEEASASAVRSAARAILGSEPMGVGVTSPLNPKIVSVAGLSAGAAALSTEERKHTENDPKCNALGWCCVPLVTESYGAWGKEAMDSFKMLASRLAIISGKPKSVVLFELYSRLNLHLVRANATAILSRWLPSLKFIEL